MPGNAPQPVQPILAEYIRLVHEALPGLLAGLYLHGSLALDAYQPGLSDIDFITVVSRRCTPADIAALGAVHRALARRYPEAQLSGSYLEWHDLGRFSDTMLPHPYFHDGIMYPGGYHEINAVTWWILKNRGIAVAGPAPDQLDIHVDWDRLLAAMRRNMSTYWASFTTHPRRMTWLLGDYGIQWAVLGVLRQFYTFRQRSITSKVGAGIYALTQTPRRWHTLIQEAIDICKGDHTSSYRSRVVRAIEARAFLQLIITACRTEHT